MKIATYNINGVNGHLPVLLKWLEESEPDIVCLQELKAPNDKFPIDEIRAAGYDAIWHGQSRWNGVAILSKNYAIKEVGRILPGDVDDDQSRYLEAMVNDVLICCLYLPNGNPAPGPKLDYKLRWMKRLMQRAEVLQKFDIPVILIGDFNVIPTELDVYKPEKYLKDALFLPQVRDAFHLLVSQGWTDALRTLYPDEVIYSFWDYFRNAYPRNAGMRIDHFLLSPKCVKSLVSAGVDMHVRGWEKTSDHAPVWIEIK